MFASYEYSSDFFSTGDWTAESWVDIHKRNPTRFDIFFFFQKRAFYVACAKNSALLFPSVRIVGPKHRLVMY